MIALWLYLIGLAFWLGMDVENAHGMPDWVELIGVVLWPISIPFVAFMRRWQWGTRRHRLYRYANQHWWQRGEKTRRGDQ